ncbi:Hsp20/alpha crystallin family protein [Mucilaginibacter rubeus]|uniref:Hsp20/alpha crystallin family protein n=1 Tax=Mucilaginibacter rubeus TaxID=2027860 RepID=A0AAE6JKM7_9SPHI|nr:MULTISPECIES: Hsp20/alpha crystallin family protein [Mucilaginibacter]QEM07662.1 Hsp20/alpha crystallin family protein [Mucilaginibacter rubeus]QEM20117.1 Hsp20/alpha crystallin family protein [Mucilaginibacter gossypii]QTE34882.1 Hsp20/alpha crystallin family protein [Mucilaginibacter gossypii]QTE43172.1 Hsp20/alpha crystallin family protein [Mucilaginibacter rubeus]QTE49772.1 Hsp20/alpha crystallin family protein [Mucilaginibacter rubeus]
MKTQVVSKFTDKVPALFEDIFKPWTELFDGGFLRKELHVPAVNIIDHKGQYILSMSAPGLKKEDFKIDVDGDVLTISSEKEESKEEKEEKYTRKEYNYSSFSRSFTLPEGTDKEKVVAKYEDGVLKITVPHNHQIKSPSAKHIAVN